MSDSLNMLIIVISILISVAFYTLLERKVLSYIQLRKGPNKVGLMGILQPFSDALKLFNKTITISSMSNFSFILLIPLISLMLSLIMWPMLPLSHYNLIDSSFNLLVMFIISSLSVYAILATGWITNSKYSQIGSLRSVAQMISYEINFFMMILFILMMVHSYKMKEFWAPQSHIPYIVSIAPFMVIWLTTCIAEVNRSPFDFAEGESELVSGFNVEYAGTTFALIFLAEYTAMLFLSMMSVIIFTGKLLSPIAMLTLFIFIIMFLWVRGSFPRFRYDLLMNLNWKCFIPVTTLLILPALSFLMF